jgi:DNA-binding FadR family transcriptional regulator
MAALQAANATADPDAFSRARRALYRALLATSASHELRRLFPSIQMPIVYAQHRMEGLQQIRMSDYANICTAVLAGDADRADAAGMQHVRNVQLELLRTASAAANGSTA